MPVLKECVVCGVSFSVPPVRANTAMFCGRACKAKHASEKYLAERVQSECQQCGKPLSASAGRAARGNGKFCSRQCKNLSLVGHAFRSAEDGVTTRHGEGYILERAAAHPHNVNGYIMQHRLIIENRMRKEAPDHPFLEEIAGVKYLRRGIEVHHMNEQREDNRPKNLVACTSPGHKDLHAGRVPMDTEIWPVPKVTIPGTARWVDVTCLTCGKGFQVCLSLFKARGAKYCSNACAARYRSMTKCI